MTTLTLVGLITDSAGHAEHRSTSWDGRVAVETRSYQALASIEYRRAQPPFIPVRTGHGGRDVGRVLFLERRADGAIVAVTVVTDADDLMVPSNGPHYWSPELRYRHGGTDIEITELVATRTPATLGLAPLDVVLGDAHQAADWVRARRRPQLASLLERAAAAERRRGPSSPIDVEDRTSPTTGRLASGGVVVHPATGRPVGAPIEWSNVSASRILSVR